MKKLFTTPVILFIVIFSQVYAQDTSRKGIVKPLAPTQVVQAITTPGTPVQNTDRSLKGQYRYLLTKVYNYQAPVISAFYKNAMDSLKIERAELKKARATVTSQAATIKTLNVQTTIKDQVISDSKAKVDEIRLLGIPFTKATYNVLMWGLVIGFGLALVIVITTTARAKQEAKYRIKLY
ncbi:MAG: hypothetical protein EOP54_19250, partial [Sphingobacteriales bacterium]